MTGVLVSKRSARSFYWNITSKGDEHDGEIKNVFGGCAACCSYIRNERSGNVSVVELLDSRLSQIAAYNIWGSFVAQIVLGYYEQ